MNSSSALLAALLCLAPTLHAQEAASPDLAARIDSLARAFVADAPAAGVSIAVIRGRDTIAFAGYGEQDRERHVAMSRDAIHRIGSITKQFTAAAVLQHVEQGDLRLTDTLGALLPQFPRWAHITLRQLLNHTSGIHSYTATKVLAENREKLMTRAEVMALVSGDSLDFAPGTDYRYNNSGYFLLGMILERIESKPYADIMRDRFFQPLQMKSASYCPNLQIGSLGALGYGTSRGKLVTGSLIDMSIPFAAGALCMSVGDFLVWQTALTSGKIVTPATFTLMTTPDTLLSGKKLNYGFGLVSTNRGGHAYIQHGGDIDGFSTAQGFYPADSLRVVVFANTLGSGPSQLSANLASVVLGLPLVPRPALPAAVALAAPDRARYEASFDLSLPNARVMLLRIFVQGDNVLAQLGDEAPLRLRYIGADTFATEADMNFRLTVVFDASGRGVRARVIQGGTLLEGSRRS